jgi:hypothetical protein
VFSKSPRGKNTAYLNFFGHLFIIYALYFWTKTFKSSLCLRRCRLKKIISMFYPSYYVVYTLNFIGKNHLMFSYFFFIWIYLFLSFKSIFKKIICYKLIFLVLLYYFNVLISKIIFFKIYFNTFLNKKYFKKQYLLVLNII